MNSVHSPNSVNPKPLWHGNTEPSIEFHSKACVETGREISPREKGTVRATMKVVEPNRNDLASVKRVTKLWCHRHDFIPGHMALLFSNG